MIRLVLNKWKTVYVGNHIIEPGKVYWGYYDHYHIIGYERNGVTPIKEISNYSLVSVEGHGNLIYVPKEHLSQQLISVDRTYYYV